MKTHKRLVALVLVVPLMLATVHASGATVPMTKETHQSPGLQHLPSCGYQGRLTVSHHRLGQWRLRSPGTWSAESKNLGGNDQPGAD